MCGDNVKMLLPFSVFHILKKTWAKKKTAPGLLPAPLS
jgi:hypothetical protein